MIFPLSLEKSHKMAKIQWSFSHFLALFQGNQEKILFFNELSCENYLTFLQKTFLSKVDEIFVGY